MKQGLLPARLAGLFMLALIVLGVAQELWLAPLHPGGSWLVLKVIPLLLALSGVLRRDNYTLQWSSMMILLYFTEGVVRATAERKPMVVALSWIEVVLALLFFVCALVWLRPIKQAARAARTQNDPKPIRQTDEPLS